MLLKNIYNEFIKILAKPRSYIGIGALTLLICIILFAMKADGSSFISFVTSSFEQTLSFNGTILNGNLIAFIILQMLIVHIPLLVALVTGDLISGEAAMGTVRMIRSTFPITGFFASTSALWPTKVRVLSLFKSPEAKVVADFPK